MTWIYIGVGVLVLILMSFTYCAIRLADACDAVMPAKDEP